jgi:hypothetical protein
LNKTQQVSSILLELYVSLVYALGHERGELCRLICVRSSESV